MSRNFFTKPFPQIATMRFCSDIWNMRDSALSNRSNLKFEYLNKIDTKCKSMLINLLVTPLGGLVWWEKKVLWHWVVLFCLLNIHETSPYFIYSVRCYLLVGIAYWNAKKSIRKCTHVLYCTVRNVWADFVVRDWWRFCKAQCDVKFRQIEETGRKFCHIALSKSVIS